MAGSASKDERPDEPHDERRDAKAERRAARHERALRGMQVTNRGLRTVHHDLDAQRRRNAARGLGPITDDEVRRLGRDR